MNFIHDDFMLQNEVARKLYHNVAKVQKIIDYHCHLDPKMIAENQEFNNITDLWLRGDHYKWRAMRANGVDEKYITGDATDKEKFQAWAQTIEACVGNPLYHWSALELKRYFDIDEILNEENWEEIWNKANQVIKERNYTPRKIIEMSNVAYVCTTDGPNDTLEYHQAIRADKSFGIPVCPGFRPDEMFAIHQPKFKPFFQKLEQNVNSKITNYDEFIQAIYQRIDYFAQQGCTISDHGLENLYFVKQTKEEVDRIFAKVLAEETISTEEYKKYLSRVLLDLGKKYTEMNWVMQIHYGAIRNNDELIFNTIGADAGTDSMKDQADVAENLNLLLSTLKVNQALPKFIIYNLEPSQNYMIACTLANFSSNLKYKAQLQYGSGWWFNDTKEGMLRQMTALADQGLLSNFVGMLTDSRSFISYIRHEYFRRILCQFIGDLVIKGEIPNDEKLLTKIIKNITHDNAVRYFELEGESL